MGLEQRLAEWLVETVGRGVHRCPLEDLAEHRVAVGVRTARCDADQHVAVGDVGAREEFGTLGDADQRAGDVERARLVNPWHLSRFATEQRAAGGLARIGHTADDLSDEVGIENAGRDVIEKEQRPSRLDQHIVDAVVDDVHADTAHHAESGSQFDLRTDTVG